MTRPRNAPRPMPQRLVRKMKKLAAQHPELPAWEVRMRVLNEDCVSPEPWTRHLYWLMPRRWPWLVGGPDANLILTYPLWCFAAVGLIWGFMLTVVGIEILNGGLVGAIHNGSLMLFMTRGGPTAHLLEGRLTGQAARDAWATIITHAVYVSPVFSLWGAFKVFNGSPYD